MDAWAYQYGVRLNYIRPVEEKKLLHQDRLTVGWGMSA